MSGLRKVFVRRAGGIAPGDVPEMLIVTSGTPPLSGSFEEAAALYNADAVAIVDAMLACLPGGTVDRVLVRLMEKHASLLRVRMPEPCDCSKGGAK